MARSSTRITPNAAVAPRRRSVWQQLWRHRVDYLLVAPFFVIFGTFHLYPLGWALFLSFNQWSGFGPMKFIGLDNYRAVLTESEFHHALINTIIFTVVLVPSGVLLSLVFASILNIRDLRGRGIFRTIYFLPFVTSTVIVAIVFQMVFDNAYGWANDLLRALGEPAVKWLSSTTWAKVIIILLAHWQGLGYNTLIMLGGLQSIDREIYEAAEIDGAGRVRIFWSITTPLMRPVMLFVMIIGTIGILNMFTQPYILTGGGPENSTLTLTLRLYQLAFSSTRYGDGAALGFVIGALVVLVTMTQFRLLRAWRQ